MLDTPIKLHILQIKNYLCYDPHSTFPLSIHFILDGAVIELTDCYVDSIQSLKQPSKSAFTPNTFCF